MAWVLLYVGLIDFSYAENLAKDLSELTGTEIDEENVPMILAQEKSTTGNYEFQEPYGTKKVEEEYDENDAGVRQKKRNERRNKKIRNNKN